MFVAAVVGLVAVVAFVDAFGTQMRTVDAAANARPSAVGFVFAARGVLASSTAVGRSVLHPFSCTRCY